MPSEKKIEAARELVRRSLVFANWAAGEGIAPIEGSIKEPADFLMDFSDATDVDDWDGLAEQVLSILAAAEQAEPAPAARSGAVKVDIDAILAPFWSIFTDNGQCVWHDVEAAIEEARNILAALEPAEPATDVEPVCGKSQHTETRPPESRLREALEQIANLKTVRDRPDDYNRGFADGRWQAVKIARSALAQEDGR